MYRTIGHTMSDEECATFSQFFFTKTFDKKTILNEEGKRCRYVYFIVKGACYSCYANEIGDKHAMQFAIEGYWISDHYSFFSGQPGMYTIETVEPTEVLVLNRENYDKICASSHLFEHFFHILIQNAFTALQYRLALTNSECGTSLHGILTTVSSFHTKNTSIPDCFLSWYQTTIIKPDP